MRPVALTVAGSDPSGGAGLQADLKTFHQHGVYGAAAISLLTVQNTRGLTRVAVQAAELVAEQIDAVAFDLTIAAMKTGALGDAAVVSAVAAACKRHGLRPVVDPVRISKAGASLLDDDARDVLCRALLPLCALVTPNLEEAAWLTGRSVETDAQIRDAARVLADLGAPAVLIKGGHRMGAPNDLLYTQGAFSVLEGLRVDTRHTHGVGCTLSAAICARLALGISMASACAGAKGWLQRAIANAPGIGQGQGPVDHFASRELV